MILVSSLAVLSVFTVIFVFITVFSIRQLNSRLDLISDLISDNNGVFLPFDQGNPMPNDLKRAPGFFTQETPFSTRFFTVWFDEEGNYTNSDLTSMFSIGEESAINYANAVLASGKTRGWSEQFRYKVFNTSDGSGIVFVDGSMNLATTKGLILTVATVMLGGFIAIFALIVWASKKAMLPIDQSYEKQKQFITDANHELKTPLTLILTNIDIVEQEIGHNEWLDDIRVEGQRMSELIGQLTSLSRLDESSTPLLKTEFSLTDVCNDTIYEFSSLAFQKGLDLTSDVQPQVLLSGDEASVRRLISILIDNAIKYCDPSGQIYFSLEKKRHMVIVVENTYSEVENIELNRLFERFYREDKARTSGTGFGIGLSLAKSIVEAHKGSIQAYQAGPDRIGFRLILK